MEKEEIIVSVEDLVKEAKALESRKGNWHYHDLPPKCMFNKTDDYVFLLEDEDGGKTYRAREQEYPVGAAMEMDHLESKRRSRFPSNKNLV